MTSQMATGQIKSTVTPVPISGGNWISSDITRMHLRMLFSEQRRAVSSHVPILPPSRVCRNSPSLLGIRTGICDIPNCVDCVKGQLGPDSPSTQSIKAAEQPTTWTLLKSARQTEKQFSRQYFPNLFGSDTTSTPTQFQRNYITGDADLPELVNGHIHMIHFPPLIAPLLAVCVAAALTIPWSRLRLRF